MWNQSSIKKILLSAAGFVDEKYNSHRQKLAFNEYIEHYEFGLALDSLLELVDETEEKFTKEFWLLLKEAAQMMKLSEEVKRIDDSLENLRS